MTTKKHLPIGALARGSGVPIETIRYYERIGLLPAPQRALSGYRAYGQEDVHRLHFIRRARELGFGIPDVRALLELAGHPSLACVEARVLAIGHLEEVRCKIRDLTAMQRVLEGMIARCERGESPDCPLIQALSYASELGEAG